MRGASEKSEISKVMDDHEQTEMFARAISLSLESLDAAVEDIAEYYHETLVNLLAEGAKEGQGRSHISDQKLFALVQSVFVHLGAARDYYGAFLGAKFSLNGSQNHSMSMGVFLSKYRQDRHGSDQLLEWMIQHGYVSRKGNRLEIDGWMKESNNLRKLFIHRRPYGTLFAERFGTLHAVDRKIGLFRYFRPVAIDGNTDKDIFDVIIEHYKRTTHMLFAAAEMSGNDTSMIHITGDDIIDFKVVRE